MAQRILDRVGSGAGPGLRPPKFAVRVQLDPRELASRGIGVDEVADAIRNANVNLPTGILYGPITSVHRPGQRADPGRLRLQPVIVAYRNGSPSGWETWATSSTASRRKGRRLVQRRAFDLMAIFSSPARNGRRGRGRA